MGMNGAGWLAQGKLKDNKHRKRGLAVMAKTADCGRADQSCWLNTNVVRDPQD